jgi:hypothetical protein
MGPVMHAPMARSTVVRWGRVGPVLEVKPAEARHDHHIS